MSVPRYLREQVIDAVGPGIGNVYFLCSTRTDAYAKLLTSRGVSQGAIFTDFATAEDYVASAQNDVLVVYPGTYTIAASTSWAKAMTTIIGVGKGTYRPIFSFSATASQLLFSAADVQLNNVQLQNGIDSLVAGVQVTAAGFQMINCEMSQPTATNDALIWLLTTAAADDIVVKGCTFRASHAGPTEAIRLVGADRAKIIDNYLIGSWSTAAINGITTVSLEILIANNSINNSVVDKLAIDLVASCTGRIERNTGTVVSTGAIADAAIIDAANCQLAENYFSDAVGETGKLIGTVSA
jgi:hypothetical protein